MPESTGTVGALVDPRVLARFEERIAADLEQQPLEADADELRRGAAELVPRAGSVTHYELLGTPIAATMEEVHEAYCALARRVHPSIGEQVGLPPGLLRVLFEHATNAYLVLSDPDRRREYDVDEQFAPAVAKRTDEEIAATRRDMAQKAFQRAQALLRAEEYHYVVELMRDAVRWDPRPAAFALLAEALAKNPHWRDEAVESLQEAIRGAPRELAYRLRLAQLFEEMARPDEAISEYRAVLEKRPTQPDAREALERLGVPVR